MPVALVVLEVEALEPTLVVGTGVSKDKLEIK
jgi:hypothetical protein